VPPASKNPDGRLSQNILHPISSVAVIDLEVYRLERRALEIAKHAGYNDAWKT